MKKKQTKITRKEAIKKFGKYAAMTCLLYTSDAADDC